MMAGPTISFVLLAGLLASLAAGAPPEPAATSAPAAPSATTEVETEGTTATVTATSATPAETVSAAATDEPAEPAATSVASDVIGPSTDETERAAVAPAMGGVDETETGDEGPGIEPKSISASRPANNLAEDDAGAGASDENAKLMSIDSSAQEGDKSSKLAGQPIRLNMSQVDEQFVSGRRDEAETVAAWNKLSAKLKRGIGGVIGAIVPMALNMSQEAKISSNCSGAMLKWVLSMNQLKAWALRMLDASGKPIAGLLEGSMTMFGNYRQCLKIRAPDDDEIEFAGEFREYFRGKYCIIQAKPWLPPKERFYSLNAKLESLMSTSSENEWYEKTVFEELNEWLLAFNFVNIRFDLCAPSLCSREDLQKAINYMTRGLDLKTRVARCEMEAPSGAGLASLTSAAQVESGPGELVEALAATAPDARPPSSANSLLDWRPFHQLGWALVPMAALLLVLLASLLSWALGARPRGAEEKRGRLRQALESVSLKRSLAGLLDVDYEQLADDKPLALYGLRFLLVLWVLLVESAVNLKFEFLRELMTLKDLIFWWPLQIIINSSLQYDSLILLTAFTMAYKNCLNEGANNARALKRFVLDKFVRLMPSVMLMVAVAILLPLAHRGPVWNDYVAKQSAVCQSTGWLNLFFLQNYLSYDQIVSNEPQQLLPA